jgi:MFS transporter, ACS family, hexuronate transporter
MFLSFGAAMYVLVQYSFTTYLALYLTEVQLLPLVTAGGFLAATQIGGGIGRVGWGVISDKFWDGRRKAPFALIGILVAALCLVVAFIPGRLDIAPLGLIILILGFCAIGWPGLNLALLTELAGVQSAGMAIGVAVTFIYLGNIIGPPLFGLIVDHSGSYSLAWLSLAALSLVGTAFVLLVREDRRQI